MARTKTRPAAAPSAAHAAPDPAPAPGAAAAPDSPAAAVHAALAASPGATIAVIADAAGTGKPAARTPCSRWRPPAPPPGSRAASPASRTPGPSPNPRRTAPARQPDPEGEQAGQPVDGPGGSLDGAGEDETAGEYRAGSHCRDRRPRAGGRRQRRGRHQRRARPRDGTARVTRRRPRRRRPEDAAPGEQDDDEAAPDSGDPQDPDGSDDPREEDAAQADADGEAGDAPDPALVTDLTERITQIKATADAAATVLAGGGDLRAALAGLDEIYEQAAQARRSLKAALGGRKTPAARPGGLRDKVLAHLDDHPDGAFTPHEIHKVLGNSSGAIANALDTLVKLGEAELATEKPRRFRRAAKPAAAAPGADDAGSAADSTELAGAA